MIKKENLRVSVIRNHKKFLRIVFYPKNHHDTYLKSILYSGNSELYYQKFREHSLNNKIPLMAICVTSSGPKSERKVIKKSSSLNCSSSFNDFYLYSYFQVKEIKHSFLAYIEFLFDDLNISRLTREIKIKCCDLQNHSEDCRRKWDRLKNFFSILMMDDLDERFKELNQNSNKKQDPADLFLSL